MDVRQDRYYVGDNAGRHADSMAGHTAACSLGIGGLVLLFIFLIIIAWAVHSGHDRTRDGINSGNALLLAGRQDNQALAIAFARNEGSNNAILATLLANSDRTLDRQAMLAREVQGVGAGIINHGETWGFQSFRREPCCSGRDRDEPRGGNTVVDFNTGVQTGLALGNRGLTNQQGPFTGTGTFTGA